MNFFPLWQLILKKDVEHIKDFKFDYACDGKYRSYGDISTTIIWGGVLATYIIDFGAERSVGSKYAPLHLIENTSCLAEVLLFNRGELFDDEVFEILIFNESHKIPVSIIGLNSNYHCTSAPAKFNYTMDWKSQVYRMEDKEYYIDGKQYTKDEWDIMKRSMKIDKLKQNLIGTNDDE